MHGSEHGDNNNVVQHTVLSLLEQLLNMALVFSHGVSVRAGSACAGRQRRGLTWGFRVAESVNLRDDGCEEWWFIFLFFQVPENSFECTHCWQQGLRGVSASWRQRGNTRGLGLAALCDVGQSM